MVTGWAVTDYGYYGGNGSIDGIYNSKEKAEAVDRELAVQHGVDACIVEEVELHGFISVEEKVKAYMVVPSWHSTGLGTIFLSLEKANIFLKKLIQEEGRTTANIIEIEINAS